MSNVREERLQTLVEVMASVMRRVHAGQGFRFSEFRLGPPQVRILFYIAKREDDVALKDLAEMLKVTPGAVTQFVDGLVEMDLVRREEDARDRRIIRIKLTGLAVRKLEEFRKGYLTSATRVFSVLSDGEIGQLVRLLARVNIPSGVKEHAK